MPRPPPPLSTLCVAWTLLSTSRGRSFRRCRIATPMRPLHSALRMSRSRYPGWPEPFQGKEGVRQMIRMAPLELVQTPRDELVDGEREDHDAHARARDL